MAQTRYFNYKADDDTASQNRHYMGIMDKGLYRGFDAVLAAGLSLRLVQTTTGEAEVGEDGITMSPRGVIMTGQGVVIKEDADVVLPITANNSATGRVDYIVCEHQYVYIAGGSPAIYKVLIGGANNAPPAMTNLQTLLGILTMPAGATSLTSAGVKYDKAAKPEFAGGQGYLTVGKDETITGNKTFKSLQLQVGTAIITSDGTLTLNGRYNRYKVSYESGVIQPVIVQTIQSTESLAVGAGVELFTEDDNGMILARSGNIRWSDMSTSASNRIFVADNEYVSLLMKEENVFTAVYFPGMYMMRDAKFYNTVKESSQSYTVPAANAIVLTINTNTYDVTAGDSASSIIGLSSWKSKQVEASADTGTVVRVRCVGATPLKMVHNTSTSITYPSKKLALAGSTDLTMKPEDVITFIETESVWQMIDYYSPLQSDAKFRTDTVNEFTATQVWGAVTINEHIEPEGGFYTLFLPASSNMYLIEFTGTVAPVPIADIKQEGGNRFPPGTRLVLQFRKQSSAANNSACYLTFKTDPTSGYDGTGIRKPIGMPAGLTTFQLIDLGVPKGTFGASIELVADSAGKWIFSNYKGNSNDQVDWVNLNAYDGAGGGTGNNPDTNLRIGILGRNWENAGTAPLRYKKDASGNVHIRGNVRVTGTNVNNMPEFQPYIMLLPAGLRPAFDSIHFYAKNFSQVGYPVDILINTDGKVLLRIDAGLTGTDPDSTYPPLIFGSQQTIWINICFAAEQ